MKQPYAIADRSDDASDPEGELEQERWKAKSIRPILFPRRVGGQAFAPLWETLHEWADWARGDIGWIETQLAAKMRDPYDRSTEFAQSFAQDVLALLYDDERERVIRTLRDANVDFGWIEAVEGALRSTPA